MSAPLDLPGIPPQEAELVTRMIKLATVFENGLGKECKEKWDRLWRQYRGFRQFKDAWVKDKNDRDGMLYDAKKTWGAHLHVPLSFQTIETVVPKAIAHAPRMIVTPRDEQWRKNVEAIRLLLDRQQDQIDIDLEYQAAMRSGRLFGLGGTKTYWRKETAKRRKVEPRIFKMGFKVGSLMDEVSFDDPMCEAFDVYDFLWDPHGYDTRTCDWMAHRVWMSRQAVQARLESGAWDTASAKALAAKPETLDTLGADGGKFDEVFKDRMTTAGFPAWASDSNLRGGNRPHEILEFHDGERVLTILDRAVLVQDAENPCCGMMPFQIYRPTAQSHMMVGIGDLEPIEHLQRELDSLRSQRRDAATLALCAPLAYDDGVINRDDVTFGPGVLIPTNGNPNEALQQLQIRDIPASGYQEEQSIMQNIEGVTGLSDALAGQPGGTAQTATEAQLVQASLSARIQLGSRRFEIEVVRQSGRAFLYLNQRMILEDRPSLVIPHEEGQSPADLNEGDYRFYPIGPGELLGEYEIEMEGGSMAARNIPQDRADAQMIMSLFSSNYYVNPTKPLERALELCGVKHPKAWMKAEEPSVPMLSLKFLELAGVDPTLLEEAVLKARTVAAPQEGPGPEMVTSALGGSPVAGGGQPNG